MSELPKEWAEKRLGDILTFNYGKALPEKIRQPGSVQVYGSNGPVGFHSDALINGPTIIIGRKGSVGEVHLSDGPCWPIDTTYFVYQFGGNSPEYWYWYLKHLKLDELNRATAVPGLNREDAYRLKVLVPPLDEQRRIVARLDALLARSKRARAELARVPGLVERQRQAVLDVAFHHETAEGWNKTSVAEVADTVFDGPFGSNLKTDDYVSEGVRVIRLENIGHLRFIPEKETFITFEKFEGLRRHTLRQDDILFSSFVDEETRVCLYPGVQGNSAINKADCFCIRVDGRLCKAKFLLYRLACRSSYENLRETVHGATRPRINLSQLKRFTFGLPTIQEQQQIVSRIESAFARIDRAAAEAERAAALLDRLDQATLGRAFRGEL